MVYTINIIFFLNIKIVKKKYIKLLNRLNFDDKIELVNDYSKF